ncbi:MAG: hypothetical protein H7318_08835 [Oligoflexus sp.]|nr:hypothetical protein [Oligoflexus sp.]
MKQLHKHMIQVLTGLFLSFQAGQALAIGPVLPIAKPSVEIPMLLEAVRDPDLAYEQIVDDTEAHRLIAQSKVDAEGLLKADPTRKQEILESLMKAHERLAYFFEDVRAGRLPSSEKGDLGSVIVRNRSEASRYAAEFIKGKMGDQGQALYVIGMNQIVNGDSSGFASLNRSRKTLGKDRALRLDFLTAIKSGGKDSPAARKTLTQYMMALGASGQVAGYLYFAKIDKNPADSLSKAVKAASKLPRVDRENAISYALAIWTNKANGKVQFAKLPFDLKPHSDLAITRAIRERAVLQGSAKNLTPALQFYRSIVEVNRGTSLLAPVLERILEIEESNANSSKSYSSYEKALISAKEMMSDRSSLGKGLEKESVAALARISARYKAFVLNMIAASKAPKATKAIRSQTISIINTYVANHSSPADKVPFRADLGRIYALNGQHGEAVKTFMDLKKESTGPKAQEFLLAAMASQRVLAEWPATAPWNGVPKKNAAARTTLAEMYDERFTASNSWDDLAHHGLLLINVNNNAKAFQVWTKNLEKNPTGQHAQLAAGMMMASYQSARNWQKLEDLARLAIKAKLSPVFGKRTLDSVALLGDALFEGGREHFAQKRYGPASDKLAEFSKNYKKDKRRVEAMFVLAKAYHFDSKHPASVETLLALVNEYPASPYEHDALLFGGDWTVPMAWEDQTIFFYQRFIERFAKDAKVPAIRMSLSELYMGRELYGNAVRLHAAHTEDTRVSKSDRIDSALMIMAIEERYGDAKYAVWGAAKAREISNQDPIIVARVVSFDARRAAKSGDMNKVRTLEAQLSKLNVNERSVAESLAQLRFLIAEKQALETKQEIFNLAQTDPLKTMNAQYTIFQKTQAAYDRVCVVGSTTYCGFAMLRLSESTRNSLASIENLSIAQTLDEKSVRAFESQKLAIITAISRSGARADSIALGISEKGETTPEWSQEILVNNTDSNLERGHGATGSGYVQWMPIKSE